MPHKQVHWARQLAAPRTISYMGLSSCKTDGLRQGRLVRSVIRESVSKIQGSQSGAPGLREGQAQDEDKRDEGVVDHGLRSTKKPLSQDC